MLASKPKIANLYQKQGKEKVEEGERKRSGKVNRKRGHHRAEGEMGSPWTEAVEALHDMDLSHPILPQQGHSSADTQGLLSEWTSLLSSFSFYAPISRINIKKGMMSS